MGKFIKNQKGLGLVEVMVVVGLIAIVAVGVTSLLEGLFSQMNQASTRATLEAMKSMFRESVTNNQSWPATYKHADNPNLNCLDTFTACNVGEYNLRLFQAMAGGITIPVFAGYDNFNPLVANTGRGFTVKGDVCNGFDPVLGNDQCPIAVTMRVQITCANSAATCTRPGIVATMQPWWSPLRTSNMYKFTPNIPRPESGPPAQPFVSVARGAGVMNDPLVYVEEQTRPSIYGALPGSTLGTCTPAEGPKLRRMTTEISDPGNHGDVNATNAAVPVGNVRLQPGHYVCTAIVPAFGVGAFAARLWWPGVVVVPWSNGLAPTGIQSSATITADFELGSVTDIRVQIKCNGTSGSDWDFGVPWPLTPPDDPVNGPYSINTRLASLSCTRIN